MLDENAYWDGVRHNWYKQIKARNFDWQYVADLMAEAGNEIANVMWTTEPKDGVDTIQHIAHNVDLTCRWVKQQRGEDNAQETKS